MPKFASPGHYTDKDRDKIPASHFAGPNQTYPIEVPQDVEVAAYLVGHADDPEAVKSRVNSIAYVLGAVSVAKLPAEWTAGENSDESERAGGHVSAVRQSAVHGWGCGYLAWPRQRLITASVPLPHMEGQVGSLSCAQQDLPVDSRSIVEVTSRQHLARGMDAGHGFDHLRKAQYNQLEVMRWGTRPYGDE